MGNTLGYVHPGLGDGLDRPRIESVCLDSRRIGFDHIPEGIDVFGSQLRDRHAAQGGDLFGDVQRHGLRAPFMFRLFSGVPAERLVTRVT